MIARKLFTNGQVITPEGIFEHDILIEGEQIAAVGPGLAAADAEIIDLGGRHVLPGLIDVHTHLREPGGEHKETFLSGTSAALAGGVTSVLAMPNTSPAITDRASFDLAAGRAAASAVCDYGLYVGGTAANAHEVAQIAQAAALKLYIGSSTGDLLVDRFEAQITHLEHFPAGKVIAAHAEEEDAVRYYAARGQHRPPICAGLSVARLIALAELTGRTVHICHVSTAYELRLIQEARARGARITCEVTPHHLFLSSLDWERLGPLGLVNPPLRPQPDVDALWAGLATFDLIATDHAPHTLAEKGGPNSPSGLPGLEAMLPLLLTAAAQGRLPLSEIARLCAAGPAQVFGLRGKGRITPGFDADLTVIDLGARWVLGKEHLQTRCGWSPFEGWAMQGRVERVYLRGALAYQAGEVVAAPGSGLMLRYLRN